MVLIKVFPRSARRRLKERRRTRAIFLGAVATTQAGLILLDDHVVRQCMLSIVQWLRIAAAAHSGVSAAGR